jgi:hypothetical protein
MTEKDKQIPLYREISLRNRHTSVFRGEELAAGRYRITAADLEDNRTFAEASFQEGPVLEAGVNGIFVEDLLCICLDRLKGYQTGKFPSPDNDEAIRCLEQALEALDRRTRERERRGVEGTSAA